VEGQLRRFLGRLSGPGGLPRGLLPGRIVEVPRVWYNPDLQSRWFYVPAVLAMVLMILTMVLSSMGVVREKEIGTMEQLIVSPIRPWQLVVGKLFPFAAIGLVDIFIVTGITVGWFEVPLRGSLLLLVLLTLLLLLNTLGLGLLVSTLVQTQQQAMMTATFLFMVPMIYLSGLLFPIENMPRAIQWVTYAIPLRYYAQILRGIFLKGAGIDTLWPQATTLAAFGLGFLALAALRFRKRLD
jgi:ABC-2 type transport system permease protein